MSFMLYLLREKSFHNSFKYEIAWGRFLLAAKRIWVTFSKTGSDLPCDILNLLYVGFIVFFFVPCSPCLVPWDKLVSKVQVLSQNHRVAMLLDVKWGTSQYCWNSVRQANKSYDSSCLLEINEFCLYFLREQEINWSQCLSWNAETEVVSAYFQFGLTG